MTTSASLPCPVCRQPLTPFSHPQVSAGVCRGRCGGLLFQGLVYKKLFQSPPDILQTLAHVERDPGLTSPRHVKINCPSCRGIRMMQRYFSQEKKAFVNECGQCGRVWLHGGELAVALQEYAGKQQRLHQAQERSEAIQAYLESKQKQFEQLPFLQRLFPNLTGVNKKVDPRLDRIKEELRRPRPN